MSPNHLGRRWLRRTRSRVLSPPPVVELSYAEKMRIEALQEYQKRLAEPLALSNDVLIGFASCMLAELEMRPYKTTLALYSKV
jgi:hypothetical protein